MRDHIAQSVASARGLATQKLVGVRELKANAAHILRQVRDSRESYILTHRGRAIGVILPLEPSANDSQSADDPATAWASFVNAGVCLEHRFRRGVGGVRLLSTMRR